MRKIQILFSHFLHKENVLMLHFVIVLCFVLYRPDRSLHFIYLFIYLFIERERERERERSNAAIRSIKSDAILNVSAK